MAEMSATFASFLNVLRVWKSNPRADLTKYQFCFEFETRTGEEFSLYGSLSDFKVIKIPVSRAGHYEIAFDVVGDGGGKIASIQLLSAPDCNNLYKIYSRVNIDGVWTYGYRAEMIWTGEKYSDSLSFLENSMADVSI